MPPHGVEILSKTDEFTTETGLVSGSPNLNVVNAVATHPTGTKREWIETIYDQVNISGLTQRYTRNRVALSRRFQRPDTTITAFDTVSTFYSYDPHVLRSSFSGSNVERLGRSCLAITAGWR